MLMYTKKQTFLILCTAATSSILLAGAAVAATSPAKGPHASHSRMMPQGKRPSRPMVAGAIATVNGTTITVTGDNGTVYTVDAAKAKITKGFGKDAATIAVADLKVGDKLVGTGTLTGTSLTATDIMTGTPVMKPGMGPHLPKKLQHAFPLFGNVTAINGTTVTMELKGFGDDAAATAFAVTTNASTTVTKDGAVATMADLTVGSKLLIHGTIDRTTKTAVATKVNILTKIPTFPAHTDKRDGHMGKRK